MKARGTVCMQAEEHEIFDSTLPEKLVGQKTGNGWTIIEAKADGNKIIWLLIEGEIDNA